MSENQSMNHPNPSPSTPLGANTSTPGLAQAPDDQAAEPQHKEGNAVNKGRLPGLLGLMPFVKPYRIQIMWAGVFLILAAASTLSFPYALKLLIDQGLNANSSRAELSWHFFMLFWVSASGCSWTGSIVAAS